MFYDKAKVYVKGGDGGNGVVAFRREKYVPLGGPSGGDGGNGGNVILTADEGLRTLVDFRYQRHYKADRGEHGQGKGMHGRGAEDMMVRVPVGTVVRDAETGAQLVDMTVHGQQVVVAAGGRGGRGNARFATSANNAPRIAEKGEPGQERWLQLELKLLADVGLVGFPNAGKSTIISRISAAKPKIADYPFTTLVPNLGVVRMPDGQSFVVADIPGLIEGAHQGAGLGHEFLRHVERTRVLVHLVDMAGVEGREPIADFRTINRELEAYNPRLAKRPQVVAANKMDLPGAAENYEIFKAELGEGFEIFPVSAVTGEGVELLLFRVAEALAEAVPVELEITEPEKVTRVSAEPRFIAARENEVYVVKGPEVERHYAMTDFNNEEALKRFLRILKAMGVDDELRKLGARDGDTIRIGSLEFDFMD
ncbi:GTPase ObgE [Phosphitispora fastidiosa]|uniref:GTPase ObgE n=1 Tax=Phosphitispora fastidiosa TaxID=2837202 RepID=UPI001E55156C|nr:GTPase ObgE [Phosphitispora fastidiosa]MBU7005943.1 GTP-binding protein [Phosphitispora fastidiosa]